MKCLTVKPMILRAVKTLALYRKVFLVTPFDLAPGTAEVCIFKTFF